MAEAVIMWKPVYMITASVMKKLNDTLPQVTTIWLSENVGTNCELRKTICS